MSDNFDRFTKYERLLNASPTYKAAPPVRIDEGYGVALGKWEKMYGGDKSKLVIERSPTTSPSRADEKRVNSPEPIIAARSSDKPRTPADFIAAVRTQSADISASKRGTSAAPNPADASAVHYTPSSRPYVLPHDDRAEVLPPPPQRPYTVEWIVNSPQRTRLNPATGLMEAETLTPVPDFTADSVHSFAPSEVAVHHGSSPRHQAKISRGNEYSSPAAIGAQNSQSRARSRSPKSGAFEADINDERDDEEERMAIAAGDGDELLDSHLSVARILFLLDEFDARKAIRQRRRSDLAKMHKQFMSRAESLVKEFRESRERARERAAQNAIAADSAFAAMLERLQNDERQYRAALTSEEASHINALTGLEERHASEDLNALRALAKSVKGVAHDEEASRGHLAKEEADAWQKLATQGQEEESKAAFIVRQRIEKKLEEIRNGDPVEQRQAVEDEEMLHRFEDMESVEAAEWLQLVASSYAARPMNIEEPRRLSLGISEDLLHDDDRLRDEEEMSRGDSAVITPSPSVRRDSRRLADAEDEMTPSVRSEARPSVGSVDSLNAECGHYLHEIYLSHVQRARKSQVGYNRNGWKYTPENPDPLTFGGVRGDNGKLMGAASPVFKEAVRQFLTPSRRAVQRGETTLSPSGMSVSRASSLPPGSVISPTPSMIPLEKVVTPEDQEEMKNILRNIRKSKTFTWPRHYSSVRDRPPFPQDAECDIYRREPGPNMGNAKRYHDEIEEEFGDYSQDLAQDD